MQKIRSFIFDVCFYTFSALFFITFFPFIFIFKDPFVPNICRLYSIVQRFLMHHILGLRFRVEGLEYLRKAESDGPYIAAFQHQSAFETLIHPLLFKNYVVVLKNELFYIPIFGFYIKKFPSILIKRSDGILAIKHLLKESIYYFKKGKNILIYPEGRRILPGQKSQCQPGVFLIYSTLKCKVLPITVDSGRFWPRKAPFKKSGLITIKIHPPIFPGLNKNELLGQLNDLYNKNQ